MSHVTDNSIQHSALKATSLVEHIRQKVNPIKSRGHEDHITKKLELESQDLPLIIHDMGKI